MTIVSGILVLACGALGLLAPAVLAPYGNAPAILLVLLGLHLTFSNLAKSLRRRADQAESARRVEVAETELVLVRRECEETHQQLVAATRREADAGAKVAALEKKVDGLLRELAEAAENLATPEMLQGEIVSFLGLLQRKGRFIDFIKDDITGYTDAQVGTAARVVHQGCQAIIEEHFDIVPVRSDSEGASVTLDKDYSPTRYRLLGHVTGHPPFHGKLLHRGWMTTKVELPRVVAPLDGGVPRDIIQPAEVEVR